MSAAPNFTAVLRDINAERADEAARIAGRLRHWAADVERAVAVCDPTAALEVCAAAEAIDRLHVAEEDAVLLLGALFRAIYRADLTLQADERQLTLAGLSDAIDGLLAEVVRQREAEAAC
jgi:hypothetical protein